MYFRFSNPSGTEALGHHNKEKKKKKKKQSKGCDRKSQQRQTSTEIVTATKDLTFHSWRPVLRETGHLAPRDLR